MPDPATDIALDWHFAGTMEYFMSLRANMPNRIDDLKVKLCSHVTSAFAFASDLKDGIK